MKIFSKFPHLDLYFVQGVFSSFTKRVRCIAIRAAQVTCSKPYKNARQARKSAFALQAQINLIDLQSVRHHSTA